MNDSRKQANNGGCLFHAKLAVKHRVVPNKNNFCFNLLVLGVVFLNQIVCSPSVVSPQGHLGVGRLSGQTTSRR